ncbi:MAG: hypothetical protein WAO20_15660, partial [Acidobacteriota bacterium]
MSVPVHFYSHRSLRQRMTEFLGGPTIGDTSALYIAEQMDDIIRNWAVFPASDLYRCLDERRDLARSLWDRQRLLIHLDIEYVNFDFPGEPYLDPERSFALQQPVVESIYSLLGGLGIECLHLLSGRGHHFIWQISQTSEAFRQLRDLGRIQPSLEQRCSTVAAPSGDHVTRDLALAFAGLGQVLEYLAHRIQESSVQACRIPVQITDLVVGPMERGREIVSLDLSEYGDPLYTRRTGLPFSAYLKPERRRPYIGEQVVTRIPTLFVLPVGRDISLSSGLHAMRDPDEVLRLADDAPALIPTQDGGMRA